MAKILCIETSTEVCSVAIVEKGQVLDVREDRFGLNHSKLLTVYIQEILEANQMKAADLDALAVSEGPGSYTGLRIGVSAAKGICFAVERPLIAISPLEAMAHSVVVNAEKLGLEFKKNDVLAPMIDARRMEVYTARYDSGANPLTKVDAVIVDEQTFEKDLHDGRVLYFGNGAAKCRDIIQNEKALLIDGVVTSAVHMAQLANQKFEKQNFVDVAYFEPFYLKNFIAIKSTKNILGI